MRVRVTTEKVNVSAMAADLSNCIKNSQCNECATSDKRKCIADPAVNRHAAPHDQGAERGRKKHVTGTGQSGDAESFGMAPTLRPRNDHERKPVRRNYSVQKPDSKSCSCQCHKNDAIH